MGVTHRARLIVSAARRHQTPSPPARAGHRSPRPPPAPSPRPAPPWPPPLQARPSCPGRSGGTGHSTPGELRLFLIDQLGPALAPMRTRTSTRSRTTPEARVGDSSGSPETDREGGTHRVVAGKACIDVAGGPCGHQRPAVRSTTSEKAARPTPFDPVGQGRYRFDYLAATPAGGDTGHARTAGIINAYGSTTDRTAGPRRRATQPICRSRRGPPSTACMAPSRPRIRLGDPSACSTAPRGGRHRRLPLGSTIAPLEHRVICLVLADGSTATASPGHPPADRPGCSAPTGWLFRRPQRRRIPR